MEDERTNLDLALCRRIADMSRHQPMPEHFRARLLKKLQIAFKMDSKNFQIEDHQGNIIGVRENIRPIDE